jgi:hypothetical protein
MSVMGSQYLSLMRSTAIVERAVRRLLHHWVWKLLQPGLILAKSFIVVHGPATSVDARLEEGSPYLHRRNIWKQWSCEKFE